MEKNSKNKNWQRVKLDGIIDFNPQVQLEKDKNYSFVPMEDVDGFNKYINSNKKKKFNGSGAKFSEGDVLFARITPCLEHGKVAVAKNLEEGKGFGSGEFFVFRGIKNVTNTDFLYYISRTNEFRQTAINSMVGASGRQRARIEAIKNYKLNLPSFNEQRRIASILSAFDDKIELNNKINQTLEQMAQEIFKEWFVRFQFPGYEKVKFVESEIGKIPKGWEVKTLGEIADVQWGDTSVTKSSYITEGYPAYSASGQDGFRQTYDFDRIGIILGAIGANCGITWLAKNKWSAIKNTICFWSIDNKVSTEYLFLVTKGKESWPKRGSAQPFITLGDARKRKILVPAENILGQFNDFVAMVYSKIDIMQLENQKLAALRDLLLPKLMSGEMRI